MQRSQRRTGRTVPWLVLLLAVGLTPCSSGVASPRIYVFDDGWVRGLSPQLFGVTADQLAEVDFRMTSYLIVHPRGTLMWAAATATWIVQRPELDAMMEGQPAAFFQPATFDRLFDAEKLVLDNEELDVFGDGTVVVMPAPGHTPGHQVLAVTLANAGMIVLAGDLYHYPEERTLGVLPTIEVDPGQSRASRARVEAFLQETGGTLWIEHDIATHADLPRPPAAVD